MNNTSYASRAIALSSPNSTSQLSIVQETKGQLAHPGTPEGTAVCHGAILSEDGLNITPMELYNTHQLGSAKFSKSHQRRIRNNRLNFPGYEQQIKDCLHDLNLSEELAPFLRWIPIERVTNINVIASDYYWTYLRGTISSESSRGFACAYNNDMPKSWEKKNRQFDDAYYDSNEHRNYAIMSCKHGYEEIFKTQVIFSTLLSAFNDTYDAVAPIGFTRRNEQELPSIVLDFTEVGNFARQLENNEGRSWPDIWRYAIFLASGLRDFHNLGAIHGNLQPETLAMAGENSLPYMVNLGLSRYMDQEWKKEDTLFPAESSDSTDNRENHIPPEIVFSEPPSQASDVHALGTLLRQLVTTVPPRDINELQESLTFQVPKVYEDIYTRCWNENPQKRPTAQQIVDQLLAAESEIRKAKFMLPKTVEYVTRRMGPPNTETAIFTEADLQMSGEGSSRLEKDALIETDEELYLRLLKLSKKEFETYAYNNQQDARIFIDHLHKRQAETAKATKEVKECEKQMFREIVRIYPWKWLRRLLGYGEYTKDYLLTRAQIEALLTESSPKREPREPITSAPEEILQKKSKSEPQIPNGHKIRKCNPISDLHKRWNDNYLISFMVAPIFTLSWYSLGEIMEMLSNISFIWTKYMPHTKNSFFIIHPNLIPLFMSHSYLTMKNIVLVICLFYFIYVIFPY